LGALVLLTREPRRSDLLPVATVAARVLRVGNVVVIKGRIPLMPERSGLCA